MAATDRVWFYQNLDGTPQEPATGGGQYPGLEYDGDRPFQIDKVVYVRGTTITIQATFKNEALITAVGTLKVYEARLALNNNGTVTYSSLGTPAEQGFTIPSNGEQTFTLTFTGAPNYVALGNLELRAEARGNIGVQLPGEPDARCWGGTDWQTWEKVYLTYGAPTANQQVPWTDLLDYSCKWAFGESAEDWVCREETFGLYWGSVFAYNLGTEEVDSSWIETDFVQPVFSQKKFLLGSLLDHLASAGIQDGNCVDVSDFLSLALNSQGIESPLQQLVHVSGEPPEVHAFVTNLACPIGSNASEPSLYYHFPFSMHQQAKPTTGVCDAALAYNVDLSGAIYRNPAANWPMDGYWQTSSGFGYIYGLVYRDLRSGDAFLGLLPPKYWTVVLPDPNQGPELIAHGAPYIYNLFGVK